ncbi:MAG: tRNA preQ1(34) S-adenosylmethionine ribosyltransferase-isomerase QueA, partial [Gammaproteobacteria bacterium]|nr:tRNA preQ1(34) S-adenosylmethionine ribosyltransferase-isomerase QueA [Gammaproteobacteria bacterium]
MQLSDFKYILPERLIANYPTNQRSDSRLMCLNSATGDIEHRVFRECVDLLRPGDLLVFNDTRVIPARLLGEKTTGGRVEVLIERLLENNRALVQLRASKSPGPGTLLKFYPRNKQVLESSASLDAEVEAREGEFFLLKFSSNLDLSGQLREFGHIPLPPYIKHVDEEVDGERYQTVYASREGAVAAPTAGLHFDEELLAEIKEKGIEQAFLTLHVGAGTFQPVRVDNIDEHKM